MMGIWRRIFGWRRGGGAAGAGPPSVLRFPDVPGGIERIQQGEAPGTPWAAWCREVDAWRQRLRGALQEGDSRPALPGLTLQARRILDTVLQSEWPLAFAERMRRRPYNVAPFPPPGVVRAGDARAVTAILKWRAGLIDYVSDVWDVIGEPELGIGDCSAIERLLTPAADEPICPICLARLPAAAVNRGGHACWLAGHVRERWPDPPEGLRD